MRIDRFTQRMQEALQAEQDIASQFNHQEIANEHFLSALLDQSDGITQPLLEKNGRDLTELAPRGKIDPVIARDNEIRRIMLVISRRTKNNPVLIGDPGVGKTAIVEGLARRIISGDVPDSLKQKRVIAMD